MMLPSEPAFLPERRLSFRDRNQDGEMVTARILPRNDRHQEQVVLATATLGYRIPILLIFPDKPCLLFNNVSAIGK